MKLSVDRVIVASNENELYLPFWPFVAWAYRSIFGVPTTLAFVSERHADDPFVAQLRQHGDVELIRPVRDIPQAAQCKMARYWLAGRNPDEVCYLDDIDVIPIDNRWHAEKIAQRKPNTMLFVGPEVYGGGGEGQCPASMITGEGRLFRALFNPDGLPFHLYLDSLRGFNGKHQNIESRANHEGMACTTSQDRLGSLIFSDEALIYRLRQDRSIKSTFVERGYQTGVNTIDRCQGGEYDAKRLSNGDYVMSHAPRPYHAYPDANNATFKYISNKYGIPVPVPIVKIPHVDLDMLFGGSGLMQSAFEWICANISSSCAILELGSGHVSTNYLSRYYEVRSIEDKLEFCNQYPSHYIYAPLKDGWYDVDAIKYGISCYNTYRPHGFLIVDGPTGSEARAGFLLHMDLFDLSLPVLIDDTERDVEQRIVVAVSERTGRSVQWFDTFAVI